MCMFTNPNESQATVRQSKLDLIPHLLWPAWPLSSSMVFICHMYDMVVEAKYAVIGVCTFFF